MRQIALITLLLATPVYAAESNAPTYLSCSIERTDGPAIAINFTVDEAQQVVTSSLPSTGHTERYRALFSPKEVTFQSGDRISAIGYVLSRTDLSVKRVLVIGEKQWIDEGKCRVEKIPERAF